MKNLTGKQYQDDPNPDIGYGLVTIIEDKGDKVLFHSSSCKRKLTLRKDNILEKIKEGWWNETN